MKDFTMQLEPSVVRWAIDSSGMDYDTIARRTGVDRQAVDGWVRTGAMKHSKIERLARCVKRPDAILLLKSPPDDDPLVDYRTASGGTGTGLCPDDRVAARRARYAQSMAREMMEVQGIATGPRIGRGASVGDSAEKTADGERGRLGLEAPADGRGGARALYRRLREAIESLSILVFQCPMDARSVRGLSLTCREPCAILLNSRDPEAAMAFAALHGYAHVLLGNGGVCCEHPPGGGASAPKIRRIEEWCDGFAAAVLMPRDEFLSERRRLEECLRGAGPVVDGLAGRFKTTRYAAAVRSAGLPGGRPAGEYMDVIASAANDYGRAAGRGRGGPGFVDACMTRMGRRFTMLVLSSYDNGVINARNAIDYLDVGVDRFMRLRARAAAGR